MSLQMNLVFGILIIQLTLMAVLVLPLPHRLQETFVDIFYKLLTNQNVKIGVGFTSTIIGLLFLDSLKSAVPPAGISVSNHAPHHADNIGGGTVYTPGLNIWDLRVKKFYAQRNLYITGAVEFLSVAIYFNILLLKSLVKNKKKLIDLKRTESEGAVKSKENTQIKYEELKEVLRKKEKDLEALKKQVDGLHTAYQKKADESISNPVGSGSIDKKSD